MLDPLVPKSTGLEFSSETIQFLVRIRDFFSVENVKAYIVGGFLRDSLLRRSTGDIDIVIDHDPIEIGEKLSQIVGGKCIVLDHDRLITRVVIQRDQIDGSFMPNHLDLSFMPNGIKNDLSRRDFTVDAMALPFHSITETSNRGFIDLYGGLEDTSDKVVRAVSDESFIDDPVRLIKAIRLVAQLGFSLDEHTKYSISKNADLINSVSIERVREEFLKIFEQNNTSNNLKLMDDLGLLCKIIPELEVTRGSIQPKEHYWDVFNHCLETPGKLEKIMQHSDDHMFSLVPWTQGMDEYFSETISDGHSRLTMAKLAGLLHDISKPETKTIDNDGKIRFIGHDLKGSNVTDSILNRLRLSNKGKNHVSTMVKHHLRPTQMNSQGLYPTDRAMYRYYRDVGDVAFDVLFLNMADYLAAKEYKLDLDDWHNHCDLIDFIMKKGLDMFSINNQVKRDRLIDGRVLMETLGIGPGKILGQLLGELDEYHKLGKISTKKEAIVLAKTLFARISQD